MTMDTFTLISVQELHRKTWKLKWKRGTHYVPVIIYTWLYPCPLYIYRFNAKGEELRMLEVTESYLPMYICVCVRVFVYALSIWSNVSLYAHFQVNTIYLKVPIASCMCEHVGYIEMSQMYVQSHISLTVTSFTKTLKCNNLKNARMRVT